MLSILNCRLFQRSILMRLLQTTGLSVALMTASAAGVRAEDVTVQGAPGMNGADGVNPGDLGQPGGAGRDATTSAGSADPINQATAIGGNGGVGGTDFFECPPCETAGARGGTGGAASALATTTIISGPAIANATSTGGYGGYGGGVDEGPDQGGGNGGSATGTATASSGSGSATASAIANGGSGGGSDGGSNPFGGVGVGGDAGASSTATTAGSGDASSSASATGGAAGYIEFPYGVPPAPGNATATAAASATGGGKAIATAVAAAGFPSNYGGFGPPPPTGAANATSTAETVNGAMAKALSTINPSTDEAAGTSEATAKTSFGGVSVQSDVTNTIFPGFVTVEAIAQGGSGQTSLDQGALGGISTALPEKAYATALIGGASNIAKALLRPGDEIFGTSILNFPGSSTFDFSFRGDLILGVIDGGANIIVNGTELSAADGFAEDTVIDLGSFGPNIELTITGGSGDFVIGGAVPEASTWATLLLGFAGLGLVGYRQTRATKPPAA